MEFTSMKNFSRYITEAAVVSNLKTYIKDSLRVKLTQSSGRPNHARFKMAGTDADYAKAFKKINIKIEEWPGDSISDKYPTRLLVLTKAVGKLKVGDSIPWVNNDAGASKGGPRVFGNKALTPDALGLAGKTLTSKQIMTTIKPILEKNYSRDVAKQLMGMCVACSIKSKGKISFDNNFGIEDLRVVSADFGEILSAIWSQTNLLFKSSFFPVASNEPLVDFYGVRFGIHYPVSVKSGGGGKVTIQNIINAIKSRAKKASAADLKAEKSLSIFNIVNDLPMKDQMIELHRFMDTDIIKELSKVMGVTVANITVTTVQEFVDKFEDQEDLVAALEPWWKFIGTKLEDRTKRGNDRLRLVISPLGGSIFNILNADEEMKESLTRVAKQVTLIQVNVDVKKSGISFKNNYFKNSTFKFAWAGYAGKNKLGFNMEKKK